MGDRAARQRDHAALAEGVDAVARQPDDFEGEVDLVLLGEFLQLHRVVQQVVQRMLGVLGAQRIATVVVGEDAVHAVQRRRVHLQVQIRAVTVYQLTQSCLHVEHAPRIGILAGGLEPHWVA